MSAKNDLYLYHYTTTPGLISIIEQQELWATDIFYLNDQKEFRWGVDLAIRQLETRKGQITSELATRYESMVRVLHDTGPLQQYPVYVCSFSEEGDDLSQWRAYCPLGGFAIGFLASKLRACARPQGFKLDRCVYEAVKQGSMIGEAIHSVTSEGDEMRRSWSHPLGDGPPGYSEWEGRWLKRLLTDVAPLIKHNAFVAEKEWRLISDPESEETKENFGVRVRGNTIIPYRKVKLKEHLWDKAKVIVGPCPHTEEAKACVGRLLYRLGSKVQTWSVGTTAVPYCYW